MALTTILLKNNDITKNTIIGGNVDVDRYVPAIKAAQNTFIRSVLGKYLYIKICADFEANTLSGIYLEMFDDYIKEMVIHSSAEIYLSSGAYMVANNGITKTKTDSSETVSKEELDYLVQASRKLYNSYERDFLLFMKENGNSVPEWNISTCNNASRTRINVGGWSLRKSGNC